MNREAINKHKQREQQKIERRGIMRLKYKWKKEKENVSGKGRKE